MKQTLEQLIVSIMDAIERHNNKGQRPSLLAYNMDWFTNCSWFTQISAFHQLEEYK